jgi:hypothetical protein
MPIRQIVRDAFQVDELVHQFTVLDVEDGLLEITKLDEEHEDDSTYRIELQFLEQEKNQLQLFLKKWGPQEVFED